MQAITQFYSLLRENYTQPEHVIAIFLAIPQRLVRMGSPHVPAYDEHCKAAESKGSRWARKPPLLFCFCFLLHVGRESARIPQMSALHTYDYFLKT